MQLTMANIGNCYDWDKNCVCSISSGNQCKQKISRKCVESIEQWERRIQSH